MKEYIKVITYEIVGTDQKIPLRCPVCDMDFLDPKEPGIEAEELLSGDVEKAKIDPETRKVDVRTFPNQFMPQTYRCVGCGENLA